MKHFFLFVILVISFNTAFAEITVYITRNPPLICTHDDKLDCIGGTLLRLALEKEGLKYKIAEFPWVRAQEKMLTNPNSIFVSTGRNHYTEDQYDWFFKIYTDDVNIFTTNRIKITNNKEIQSKVKDVVIRLGSPFFAYAEDLKLPTQSVLEWYLGARMLQHDHADGMILTTLVGEENFFNIEKMNRNHINRYKIGEMQWYITRPKGMPKTAELIQLLKSLKVIKDGQFYQDLLKSKKVHW